MTAAIIDEEIPLCEFEELQIKDEVCKLLIFMTLIQGRGVCVEAKMNRNSKFQCEIDCLGVFLREKSIVRILEE